MIPRCALSNALATISNDLSPFLHTWFKLMYELFHKSFPPYSFLSHPISDWFHGFSNYLMILFCSPVVVSRLLFSTLFWCHVLVWMDIKFPCYHITQYHDWNFVLSILLFCGNLQNKDLHIVKRNRFHSRPIVVVSVTLWLKLAVCFSMADVLIWLDSSYNSSTYFSSLCISTIITVCAMQSTVTIIY